MANARENIISLLKETIAELNVNVRPLCEEQPRSEGRNISANTLYLNSVITFLEILMDCLSKITSTGSLLWNAITIKEHDKTLNQLLEELNCPFDRVARRRYLDLGTYYAEKSLKANGLLFAYTNFRLLICMLAMAGNNPDYDLASLLNIGLLRKAILNNMCIDFTSEEQKLDEEIKLGIAIKRKLRCLIMDIGCYLVTMLMNNEIAGIDRDLKVTFLNNFPLTYAPDNDVTYNNFDKFEPTELIQALRANPYQFSLSKEGKILFPEFHLLYQQLLSKLLHRHDMDAKVPFFLQAIRRSFTRIVKSAYTAAEPPSAPIRSTSRTSVSSRLSVDSAGSYYSARATPTGSLTGSLLIGTLDEIEMGEATAASLQSVRHPPQTFSATPTAMPVVPVVSRPSSATASGGKRSPAQPLTPRDSPLLGGSGAFIPRSGSGGSSGPGVPRKASPTPSTTSTASRLSLWWKKVSTPKPRSSSPTPSIYSNWVVEPEPISSTTQYRPPRYREEGTNWGALGLDKPPPDLMF